MQSLNNKEQAYSVSDFIEQLNARMEGFVALVAGEVIGNVNIRGNACYFSLKDEKKEAVLHCFCWSFTLERLGIELAEGMALKVLGFVKLWPPTGRLSFQVRHILLTGEGELKRAFEKLKKKLAKEGLFDEQYKQPLPRFIHSVGLITAAGREAQADFLTHLAPRGIRVALHDVRVEGAYAVEEIEGAIAWFNAYRPKTEALVLIRGGGGLESLQSFNSERIARAIFASKIPLICGVGHERDVTIADLVSDVRASTPTHAATIISQDWEDAPVRLVSIQESIVWKFQSYCENYRTLLRQHSDAITQGLRSSFQRMRDFIDDYAKKLKLASPELKLQQGYSIVSDEHGAVIKSVETLGVGDKLKVRFYKGSVGTKVEEIDD